MKLALTLALGAALAGSRRARARRPTRTSRCRRRSARRTQTGPVASLFVLNARGADAGGRQADADRRVAELDRLRRPAGARRRPHRDRPAFVEKWKEGEDQANIDPPNATVSVLSGASVADAVVTISAPVLAGDTLTFDAVVLEGALGGAAGPAALFIDRGGFGGFHGGGGMAGGFHGGGDFGGGVHSNYAHVQDSATPPGTARTSATGYGSVHGADDYSDHTATTTRATPYRATAPHGGDAGTTRRSPAAASRPLAAGVADRCGDSAPRAARPATTTLEPTDQYRVYAYCGYRALSALQLSGGGT